MTVNKLIERLEGFADQVGGNCEVRVVSDDRETGRIDVRSRAYPDQMSETGLSNVVLIDATHDEPE